MNGKMMSRRSYHHPTGRVHTLAALVVSKKKHHDLCLFVIIVSAYGLGGLSKRLSFLRLLSLSVVMPFWVWLYNNLCFEILQDLNCSIFKVCFVFTNLPGVNMDIMLERILSLIPHKPDGKFVHGAKKVFCDKIDINTTILSQWLSGFSKSYELYLYQIADAYNVSVEWLKGETDDPAPKASQPQNNVDIIQLLKDSAPLMSNKDLGEAIRLLAESLEKRK